MTKEQAVAYVQAMTACAWAEIEGMKAANLRRARLEIAPQYLEDDFKDVIERYGIHHNGVLTLFEASS